MSGAAGGSGTPNLVPKPVSNFAVPSAKIGPRAVCVPLDFSAETAYTITLAGLINAGFIGGVQSVFVDNSANPDSLTITTQQGQALVVPAASQAYLPLITTTPPDISFTSTGGALVTVQLLNVPMPAAVWPVQSVTVIDVTGTVAISGGTVDIGGTVDVAGTVAVSGGTVGLADGVIFTGAATSTGVMSFSAPGPASGVIDTEGYAAVSVQITAAPAGLDIYFEGSNDGTNWIFAVGSLVATYGGLTVNVGSISCVVIAKQYRFLRLLVTSLPSGTAAVSVAMLLSNPPVMSTAQGQSGPAWPVSGTVDVAGTVDIAGTVQIAGTVDVTGTVDIDGTVDVAGTIAPIDCLTFTGTISTTGVLTYASPGPASGIIDTTGYGAVCFQATAVGTQTSAFQGSNDGVNWVQAFASALLNTQVGFSTAPTVTNYGYIIAKSYRYLRVNVSAHTSGSLAIAVAMLQQVSPAWFTGQGAGSNNNTVYWYVAQAASSISVGTLSARVQSAASTNATSVKASSGNVYSIDVGNSGASDAWLKLYNKASAPTVGTDTPIWSAYLPQGRARTIVFDVSINFATGIAYAITGGGADSDTTAVAAAQVTGIINYK
jgi:hypothetical protein